MTELDKDLYFALDCVNKYLISRAQIQPEYFLELKAEVAPYYMNRNCTFVLSENIANLMFPSFIYHGEDYNRDLYFNKRFLNVTSIEYKKENIDKGILGEIFGCRILRDWVLPVNSILAVGYEDVYLNTKTKLVMVRD